jgi:ubiquinol-cytochrome c reductase cytochrome c subunit
VGPADVDFMVSTGRMPAAVPWIEVGHRGAQLPQATIDAIVAYVTSVQPGGPPIPVVIAGGNLERGRELFRENCLHCHGAEAGGASIGGNEWAPSLEHATVTQVGEAIRVGPAEMPRFGARQLSERDVDDIVTYLSSLRASEKSAVFPPASSGPVPEGLLGWISAGLMAAGAYAFSAGKKENR